MNAPLQASPGLARAATGVAAVVLAFAAVILIPPAFQAAHPTSEPDPAMLFAVGASISLCSAGLVAAGLWTHLKPAAAVVVYTIVFTTIIIVVKFSLGPWALYVSNRTTPLQKGFEGFVSIVAVAVFLLYAAVLVALYTIHRLRLKHRLSAKATGSVALFVMAGLFFSCGAAILLLTLLVFPYVPLIFITPVGVTIGLALGGALLFANAAMSRAVVVRNASLLTALFWIAFLLLAAYHVLWFVYLLGLLSLWPLKTVTSK